MTDLETQTQTIIPPPPNKPPTRIGTASPNAPEKKPQKHTKKQRLPTKKDAIKETSKILRQSNLPPAQRDAFNKLHLAKIGVRYSQDGWVTSLQIKVHPNILNALIKLDLVIRKKITASNYIYKLK